MSQGVVSSTGPGGVAATVAVWFAALAAAANLIGLLVLGGSFVTDSSVYDNSLAVFTVLGAALLTGVFAYGALRMYRGAEEGRVTVLLGAGAWLAFALLGLLTSLSGYESDYGVHWSQPGGTAVDIAVATTGLPGVVDALVHGAWLPSAVACLLPLILVLAVTARWFVPSPDFAGPSTPSR